jgi:hypothetical protein
MSLELTQGRSQTITQQREPLHRLVAEHEAQVPGRDWASPRVRHRRRRDLVLEQSAGELGGVEFASLGVE